MEEVESFFRFGPFSLSLSLSLFLSPPPPLLLFLWFTILGFSPFSSFVNLELKICNLAVAIIPPFPHLPVFFFCLFVFFFHPVFFFN